MIAADTSSLVAFLAGASGVDVENVASAARAGELVVAPVVLTEILSDPATAGPVEAHLADVSILEPKDGYWVRAGQMRRVLRKSGFKAGIADVLIAQSCLDYDLALITRDRDFRHFVKHFALKLG